jgi:hypothetical protein
MFYHTLDLSAERIRKLVQACAGNNRVIFSLRYTQTLYLSTGTSTFNTIARNTFCGILRVKNKSLKSVTTFGVDFGPSSA